jgi:hypothetical protein
MVIALELGGRTPSGHTIVELDDHVYRLSANRPACRVRTRGSVGERGSMRFVLADAGGAQLVARAHLNDRVWTHRLKALNLHALTWGVTAMEVVGCSSTGKAQVTRPNADPSVRGGAQRRRQHGLCGPAHCGSSAARELFQRKRPAGNVHVMTCLAQPTLPL